MKRPKASVLIILLALMGTLFVTVKPSSFLTSSVSTISGTVSNLNNGLLEYVNPEKPTHDHFSVYYQRFYTSRFHLGEQAIEAKFSRPMKISDGDSVIVSGYQKNTIFQVLAYRNQTQEVTGAENWVMLVLGALFFLAVAVGLLNSELVIEGTLIPKLFLSGFVLVAIYMAYWAILIREAIRLLKP